MPKSYPYRCTECFEEEDCGYHGILVFETDQNIPMCLHHDDLGPVRMVPVAEAHPDDARLLAAA